MKGFFCLNIILAIFLSSNILAESTKAKFKGLRDLYELEVEMLESSIDLINESKDLNKTINLYENLVELFCFLNKPSKAEIVGCEKYSKKLKEIYPESIYLKCIELKDLEKCNELFNKQIILSVGNFEKLEEEGIFNKGSNWDSNQRFIDLRLKLEQFDTKGSVEKLNKEIKKINESLKYDETTAVEARKELKAKYREVIPKACKSSNIYYTIKEFKINDNFLAPKKEEIYIDEDLKSIEGSFLGLEKTKESNGEKKRLTLKRVKLLTDSCLAIMKSAYKFDKTIPEIQCFLKSFILPKCKESIGKRAYISNRNKGSF